MKFVTVIDFKMPTIVGILKFMTGTNNIIFCSYQENSINCLYFDAWKITIFMLVCCAGKSFLISDPETNHL